MNIGKITSKIFSFFIRTRFLISVFGYRAIALLEDYIVQCGGAAVFVSSKA